MCLAPVLPPWSLPVEGEMDGILTTQMIIASRPRVVLQWRTRAMTINIRGPDLSWGLEKMTFQLTSAGVAPQALFSAWPSL